MNEQTFFHVSRLGQLPEKLNLNEKVVDFAGLRTDNFFNEKQYHEAIDQFFPDGISRQGKNYLFQPINHFNDNHEHSVTYSPVIEMVFELVRKLHLVIAHLDIRLFLPGKLLKKQQSLLNHMGPAIIVLSIK